MTRSAPRLLLCACGAALAYGCAREPEGTGGLSAGITFSPTISSLSAPGEIDVEASTGEGALPCLSDGECPEGQVCGAGSQVCLAPGSCVLAEDCAAGEGCDAGLCAPGDACALPELARTVPPARVALLLHRGESMASDFPGTQTRRWDVVKVAVNQFAVASGPGLELGLATFSACAPGGCSAGSLVAAPGPDDATALPGFLDGTIGLPSPDGMTPEGDAVRYLCGSGLPEASIGKSLQALVGEASLQDPTRAHAVVLIADAPESPACTYGGGLTGPIAADALRKQAVPVRTFAIGLGEATFAELAKIAEVGGTGEPTLVASPAALSGALAAAREALTACTFRLDAPLADVTALRVFVGDDPAPIPEDPASGWTFDAATQTLWLSGPPCEALRTGLVDLDLRVGCDAPADG